MLTIAEIGSNYRDLDDILNYVHRLHADVIKLQQYDSFQLYGYGEKCKPNLLTQPELEEVSYACKSLGKELMISIFNHIDIEHLIFYADHLKVASSEITYIPLLEELAKSEKEVFVSCGGATETQVEEAVKIIGKDKIILMGCRVEYPTEKSYPKDGKRLGEKHGCRWGYSDHSKEVYLVHDYCKELGAYCWEKHVKFPAIKDTADSEVAITVQDFNLAVFGVHVPHTNRNKRIEGRNGRWYRPR